MATNCKEVFSQLLRYFPEGEEGLLRKNLNLFAQACLAAGEFAQAQTYADMLLAQEPDDEQKMAACRVRLYVKLQCRNDKEFVHCPAFSKEQPEYLEWLTASSFDAQPMAELIGLADKNLRTVAQDRAAEEKRKQDEEQRRQEEEQRRQQEEARRIQEEEKRRQEEEQRRVEDEFRRQQAAIARRKLAKAAARENRKTIFIAIVFLTAFVAIPALLLIAQFVVLGVVSDETARFGIVAVMGIPLIILSAIGTFTEIFDDILIIRVIAGAVCIIEILLILILGMISCNT